MNSVYTNTEGNIMDGVKTVLNLKKLREHYVSDILSETDYSTLAELLETHPLKLFNEDYSDKKSLVKSKERLIKHSILVFNEYASFEQIFENDIDSYSIQEVLDYKSKTVGFDSLNIVLKNHLASKDSLDLYQTLLFIEKFHADLISSTIELNSLKNSIYSRDLPKEINTNIESISRDSVKVSFEINGELNSSDLFIMWSDNPRFETRNTSLDKHLILHRENDSIYGQIRFIKADTIHWIPWKTSIQHGLTAL